MAYNGYLIKVGTYTIPSAYIQADSYSVTHSVQDLDSYRDADGVLHREALEHTVDKVEFNVRNMLTNIELSNLFSNIRKQYTNAQERKVRATLYVPELDTYVTEDMYFPDCTPSIYGIFDGVIKYNAFRVAFIGY